MNDNEKEFDLSGEATRGTVGTIAAWLGWLLLAVLAVVTAVHAITLVQAHTHLSAAGGDLFAIVRIGGVVLVELFAVVTAVLLATHRLRAKQKPVAMAVEGTWFVFAAVNLVSSFAVEAGGALPAFVTTWITYGLPVSALVMGALFYVTLRLDPDAARADDEAETVEMFARVRHTARKEVLASPQMKAVIRQAEWMTLPAIIGRRLNLSDGQITHLTRQAPQLLDLNQNGVPDIQEAQARPSGGDMDLEDLVTYLVEERLRERATPTGVDLYRVAKANSFTPEEAAAAIAGMRQNYDEADYIKGNGHDPARPTQRPAGR